MKLTKKEKKLITECLLFAAGGGDLCAEWPDKRTKEMIELAKKINDPKVKLKEIYLFDLGGIFDDPKIAKKIIKHFPNLPRNS